VSQIRPKYGWDDSFYLHQADVIQTQTPINPGNSGGPLLDDQARLVGVNSFSSQDSEGLNFAVSVEDVKSFLARGHDRAAPRQAAAACEWKDVGVEDWTDPKGKATLLDTDCDGEADATLFEPKNRREPDMLMSDENGDGKYDAFYMDQNRDGDPEYALYDTDGDGKLDMRADYRKGEDEPYRWEKVSQ
jgi:hypothetical protein